MYTLLCIKNPYYKVLWKMIILSVNYAVSAFAEGILGIFLQQTDNKQL